MTQFKTSRELCSLIRQVDNYQRYTGYDHIYIVGATIAFENVFLNCTATPQTG